MITAAPGWKVDPNNPNGVIPDAPPSAFAPPPPVTSTTPIPTAPTNPITPTQPPVQTPAKPQPPKPVTAFSSEQGSTQVAENTQKLQTLKNTGLTLGPDGLARFSDMSFATAPSDAVQSEDGTWQSGGVKYALGPATSMDPELQKMNDMISTMKTQFDSTSRAAIDNIKAQFENLIKQQTDINTRTTASLDQSLLMGGSSRYAQQSSEGQHAAIMTYGLQQLADLNTREQAAVINAQQAMDAGDMKLMDQQLSIADKARADKQAAARALSEKLTAANDKLKEQKIQASRESAVSGVLSQGITDPEQIQNMLNTYDDGSSTGGNFSIKEIADTLKNLNPDAQAVAEIMKSVAQYGGTPEQLKKIGAARSVADAIKAAGSSMIDPTSAVGQYQTYTQSTLAAGKTPLSYTKWNAANEANKAYNNAYNAKAGANAADAQFSSSDKAQQKLEQDYRNVLIKEVSNRSGSIGLQDQKVNQAIHLKALIDSYKDANGNYNIPTAQFKEVTMGLATLLSPVGTTAESDRRELMSRTAAGDFKGALQYITGEPQNGNTQAIIKNLVDSIDRQGQISEDLRDHDIQFLHGLAPTDLDPKRIAALEKHTLTSYRNPPQDPVTKATQEESIAASAIKAYDAESPDNQKRVDDLHTKFPNASAIEIKEALGL